METQQSAFEILEQSVYSALETYSNVHRGSGHYSQVSTVLYEKAREIVLDYLGLKKSSYTVVFCSPRRSEILLKQIKPGSYQLVGSQEFGLPLGIKAIAVRKNALPEGAPFQSGGGTAVIVSKEWAVWAKGPDKFEAGTPAVMNVIAFARALQLIKEFGKDAFRISAGKSLTPKDILYHDILQAFHGKELLEELKKTIIGKGIPVPVKEGKRSFINFDHAASTPAFAPVWNAVKQAWICGGQFHEDMVREVRSVCAEFLGAPASSYDILFTSNATEALNLAADSFIKHPDDNAEPVVINTLLEHTSNDLPWRPVSGKIQARISIDNEGIIDLVELEKVLEEYNRLMLHGPKRVRIVAVSGASNILGISNDLGKISGIVHKYGASLVVDGAQMIAHRKVHMEAEGIDFLAYSAHKAYAPFGSGALVARKGLLRFSPDELSSIQSAGEENLSGIAALGKAILLLQRVGMELIQAEEQALTARALQGMARVPDLTLYGVADPDSPGFCRKSGVIAFTMKGQFSNQIAKKLAEQGGIGIRYGCHCSHILVKHMLKVKPGLERFQRIIATLFHSVQFPGVARVSLGIENTAEDVDHLVRILNEINHKKRDAVSRSDLKKRIREFNEKVVQKVYGS